MHVCSTVDPGGSRTPSLHKPSNERSDDRPVDRRTRWIVAESSIEQQPAPSEGEEKAVEEVFSRVESFRSRESRPGWCAEAAPNSCWRRAAASARAITIGDIRVGTAAASTTSTSGSYVVASCWSSGLARRGADRHGAPAVSGLISTRHRRWPSSLPQAARHSSSWYRSTSTRLSAP